MSLRIVTQLQRATHQVARVVEQSSVGPAVSAAEAPLLSLLAGEGAASISDLHRSLEVKPSTLTSILDRLAARGLVRREVHPDDRRSFLIRLTPRGRALAARVVKELRAFERDLRRDLSPRELNGFLAVTEAIAGRAAERKKPRR